MLISKLKAGFISCLWLIYFKQFHHAEILYKYLYYYTKTFNSLLPQKVQKWPILPSFIIIIAPPG